MLHHFEFDFETRVLAAVMCVVHVGRPNICVCTNTINTGPHLSYTSTCNVEVH